MLWWIFEIVVAQTADNLAAVYKDQSGNFNFLSPEGKVLIPAQFKDATAHSDGVALVKIKKSTGEIRFGFIDKSGILFLNPYIILQENLKKD